jgi:hypothetical protein
MIHVSLEKQAASLLMAGFSVARASLLTGISRDRIVCAKKGITPRPRSKSHRKPGYLFERLELFISLVHAGMEPHAAIEICGRDHVLTAINYLFQYKKRRHSASRPFKV